MQCYELLLSVNKLVTYSKFLQLDVLALFVLINNYFDLCRELAKNERGSWREGKWGGGGGGQCQVRQANNEI